MLGVNLPHNLSHTCYKTRSTCLNKMQYLRQCHGVFIWEWLIQERHGRGSGGHWWHWLEQELPPRLAKSRYNVSHINIERAFLHMHAKETDASFKHIQTLYVYRIAMFWCLPLCLCSPILIFWWNYPCHNVCAVSEVAGVWSLGPEGWRRDHQRLPPIHLECSRGVKIWSLGGSANRCFMFCKILIVTIQYIYILFMALYMLQVAYISVHICKSIPNRGKHQVYTYVCLRHVIYLAGL